jgi:hypothetical protein
VKKLFIFLLIPCLAWGAYTTFTNLKVNDDTVLGEQSTDTITITGTMTMQTALLFADGTVSLPGISWASDTNSGEYRIGADNIGLSLGGVKKWDYAATTTGCGTTLDIGTSGTPYEMTTGDNVLQVIVNNGTNTGGNYEDAAQIYIYGKGGDNTGAIRGINVRAYESTAGNYAEIYGSDIEAILSDGTHANPPVNLYNIGYVDSADVTTADQPTGYKVGLCGILDNTGGAACTASIEAGVAGFLKDAANNDGYPVVAVAEGDSGASPASPTNAYFKAINMRSTAGDVIGYGLDLHTAGSLVPEVRVADIRFQNEETIDNLTDGLINITGNINVTGMATLGDNSADTIVPIGVFNDNVRLGATGTRFELASGENAMELFVNDSANAGGSYDDILQVYGYGLSGDGTGGLRGAVIRAYEGNNGSYGEVYGCDIEALQLDGTHSAAPANLYNILYTDSADVTDADQPTGMKIGAVGIIDNTGGASCTAPVEAALVGCVKDATNNDAYGVMSFYEGDSGLSPTSTTTAYFKCYTNRSTWTDYPAYGLDINCGASGGTEVKTADVRLCNEELIDNLTNGTVNVTGHLKATGDFVNTPVTLGAGDTSPDVSGGNVIITAANGGGTAITVLDNEMVGAFYTIICGNTTNATTISDGGNFTLTGNWTPNTVGDNITVYCAAADTYYEVARADN